MPLREPSAATSLPHATRTSGLKNSRNSGQAYLSYVDPEADRPLLHGHDDWTRCGPPRRHVPAFYHLTCARRDHDNVHLQQGHIYTWTANKDVSLILLDGRYAPLDGANVVIRPCCGLTSMAVLGWRLVPRWPAAVHSQQAHIWSDAARPATAAGLRRHGRPLRWPGPSANCLSRFSEITGKAVARV